MTFNSVERPGALPTRSIDSIGGTAWAKTSGSAQPESPRQAILPALRRCNTRGQKCARPDRGCPGGSIRSMQGGWGAQHRSDMRTSFFVCRAGEWGDIGLDRHWSRGPGGRFNVFLKMLTRGRAWRVFPRNATRFTLECAPQALDSTLFFRSISFCQNGAADVRNLTHAPTISRNRN
jgi:hypothetical protein